MSSLDEIQTVAWIPEESIAGICSAEFLKFKLEFARMEGIDLYLFYYVETEYPEGDYSKMDIDGLYLNADQIESVRDDNYAVLRAYQKVRKKFKKATGLDIIIQYEVVNANVYAGEDSILKADYFHSPKKIKWVTDAVENLQMISDLDGIIVTYEY